MDGGTEVGETTHTNWCQREGKALKSMCFGFLAVIICSMAIFRNEENFVLSQATADVIAKATVVDGCTAQSTDDGSLIFAACSVTSPDIASHLPGVLQAFVPEFHGASLSWSTEILQWVRTSHEDCQKNNKGGEDCTTHYDYEKEWVSSPEPDYSSHPNKGEMPSNVGSDGYTVPPFSVVLSGQAGITTNGFALDSTLQSQIPSGSLTLQEAGGGGGMWMRHGALTPDMLSINGEYLMTGSGDEIGDIRISASGKSADVASICAKQMGRKGGAADTRVGAWPPEVFDIWGRETSPLEYLRAETYTKDEFQAEIQSENKALAYFLRLVLFVVMVCAFNCIFQPISVAADLLRVLNYCTCCLGSILDNAGQCLISCVSCMTACWCFTVVFTVAWLVANPTYGVAGVVIVAIISAIGVYAGRTMGKKADARAPKIACEYLKLDRDGRAAFLVPV